MEARRLTAKKSSLKEVMNGRFVKKTGFESSYVLTNLGRKLTRVNILGLIVDKYISPDEKYATITIDDATDTMRCKSFVNVKIFDGLTQGELINVIGKLREYNGEIYVMPEIIRKVPANFETLRMLELVKIYKEQNEKIKKVQDLQKKTSDVNELKAVAKEFMSYEDVESITEAEELLEETTEEKEIAVGETKGPVLNLIEGLDNGDGVEYKDILEKSKLSENEIDMAIQELLESGICFEPKPGKIKKL